MLTKSEIIKPFPNPSLEELISLHVEPKKKENVIKTTVLKEEIPLNIYLPLVLPKVVKPPEKRILYDHEKILEKERKLEEMRKQQNNFPFKPNINKKKIEKSNSEDKFSQIINSITENKLKFKEIEERNKRNYKAKPFNLNQLVKKVRNITKSVDSIFKHKINNKYEFANNFRQHAISNKKDSSTVDEFYGVQKSIDNIHLQKIIVNGEYYNMIHKIIMPQKKIIMYNSNDYDTINEDNLNNNKKKLKHNRNVSKNDLYRSINYICSRNKNCIENNHFSDDDNILYKNKNYEKDLLERKNIKFFHRYQNILRNLKTEETKHYKNKIFNKEDIDKIMKSKNLLEYDKLKYDFAFKIGSLEAINRNPFKRNKKIKTDILKKKKELITNTIENKVNTAINNLDEGKRESKHYNIEDFIKL